MARDARPNVRRSLFDSLPREVDENLYCRRASLTNEASVEQFFANRMLTDLGYEDSQIEPKKSIAELTVSLGGARTEKYKPDYVLKYRRLPRWVMDAKSTLEDPSHWVAQCSAYCLSLNQSFPEDNPVEYFLLTNGLKTLVYKWDNKDALLELDFSDFQAGTPKYEQLRALLVPANLDRPKATGTSFIFHKPDTQLTQTLFASCHRIIWKSEGSNPNAAFMEFTKLMFVKLWYDRQLRMDPAIRQRLEASGSVKLPKDAVIFSTHWIDGDKVSTNPVNDILFRKLRNDIEIDIDSRKKKRIFDKDEDIDLRPDTIRAVVNKLQHYDMFGIDEDLNGRLFEHFPNATMRGKELGQYFTPRSIVKTMTKLADLQVTRTSVDKVLDACCGTGGFLIEVLTDMRNQVRANTSLREVEREALVDTICNQSIYGIDFGKSPPIARIARINMYLHGDGGSRIYAADALDKMLVAVPGQDRELTRDQSELRTDIEAGLRFQCVLSNPPFSMTKELRNDTEATILRQYELAKIAGTSKYRNSLRSNAMFMERYGDLLDDGGRLLTVIDDGMLAGDDFAFVRDFLRNNFIIRAVISLPGDAFQRSGARAKTSILYLTKRGPKDNGQPDVFVYECRYIGMDDVVLRTPPSVAERARRMANAEADEVVKEFRAYMAGGKGPWLVPGDKVQGRLDAKFLRPWKAADLEPTWKKVGAKSVALSELVEAVWEPLKLDPDDEYSFLRISYLGHAEAGDARLGREVGYGEVSTAKAGDIVVSNISAVYRAICVLPKHAEQYLISKEFTVLRPIPGASVDTFYLWTVLRSAAVVAEWLSGATGVGRHRVDWDLLRDQRIPLLTETEQIKIGNFYRQAEEYEAKIVALYQKAGEELASLELEGEIARDRLARAKPPK